MATYTRINKLLVFLVITGCATSASAADKPDGPQRPNIIFIMADDLGWQDVGYAGAEFFETPHIDAVAAQGMVFTDAYTGGPNCSPTRGCLMSGMYTPRHAIYQPGGISKGNPKFMRLLVPARQRRNPALRAKAAAQFKITNDLDPDFVCIPEVLKTAGYTSARLGKWHLGTDTQGFDLSSSDGKGGPGGKFYGDVDVAEQLTDRAVEFIEQHQEGPFFLYLSHWDVHTPHRARKDVVQKYQDKLDKIPADKRRNFKAVYAAMIEAVDTSVGRVVAKVDELGLADNTLIIFTSDNGGLSGVSQLAPLRGEKGSLFDAGVRVPTCMRWTGTIPPKSTCPTPITSVDFLPTLASLAGAKPPATQPVDGTDISPLLRRQNIAERSIFWHYPLYLQGRGLTIQLPGGGTYSWRGVPVTSMRRGDYKLMEFHEDNSIALYNLKDDPGEQKDLAQTMPDLAATMRAELDAWQKETKAPIPTELNPAYDLSAKVPRRGKAPRRKKNPKSNTAQAAGSETARKPNFIIIFTDDQGYNDLGCFGSQTINTPFLDQLAAEGRRFTNFYVPCSVCSPSRAALLTGSYPKRVGMHRHVLFPRSDYGLHPDEHTIADQLRSIGYATACIGKWHLGHHPETLPRQHGFDSYYGIPYSNDMNHPDNKGKVHPADDQGWIHQDKQVQLWNTPLIRNEEIIELPVNQRTITRRYTDEAIKFVTANKDQPFFLYLPHSMPHIPLFVPEDVHDPDPQNAYKCVIEHIDAEVGRLAQTVRDLGLANNTYIIFTTDNGPWLRFKHHGGSALPLRDGKGTTFEGGQRVPCIMWGPGRIPAGTTSAAFASTLDLLPSIASLAGSKLPADLRIDGHDLTKTITGDAPSPRNELIYYSARGDLEGLRQGDWKLLVKTPRAKKGKRKGRDKQENAKTPQPQILLFNLADDVSETTNLANQHPEKVRALRARMIELDDEITSNARPVWRKD